MTTPPFIPTYRAAGVDTEQEALALERLLAQLRRTWPQAPGTGTVRLDLGFFANVIELGGVGLALTVDGVGTKALIAQMLGKYDTIGIDCVAMNVNDLLCVGATPVSMVDYIAVQEPRPELLAALAEGLCRGARLANVSIVGGETAQIRDMLRGYREGEGFDLAAMAVGTVPLDRILVGQEIAEGDVVIGLESNGIHSNGLTLARRVFFEWHAYTVDTVFPALGHSLGEELLKPTHIYVREVLALLAQGLPVKALIHLTGGGWLNLRRVAAAVGYVIETLPPVPPIFSLIQEVGGISDAEMFRVYNMGIGFCVVVAAHAAPRALALLEAHGRKAYVLGHAVADDQRRVFLKPKGLVSQGNAFVPA
ncbi:MAG: phosphoribosylaminoimidazole synthetase [Candidatus Tectimicrobiota bacterium]|nr:MAG: phosphoribosylaminoimidazole synthetase [Candidatus Tectomicrobia bacterium]